MIALKLTPTLCEREYGNTDIVPLLLASSLRYKEGCLRCTADTTQSGNRGVACDQLHYDRLAVARFGIGVGVASIVLAIKV